MNYEIRAPRINLKIPASLASDLPGPRISSSRFAGFCFAEQARPDHGKSELTSLFGIFKFILGAIRNSQKNGR